MARRLTYDELEDRVRTLEKENEDLRESEEKFRAIFENSMDAIFFAAPDGRIFSANPAACAMTGYTETEMVEQGREAIVDPKDPILRRVLDERRKTGRFRGEVFHLRNDGTKFPCEVTSVVFSDKSGEPRSVNIARGITERKRAEQTLLENEAKYRTLFEMESDALIVADDESLRIMDANEAAAIMYQWSKEELRARRVLDLSAEPEKSLQGIKNRVSRVALRWHLKKDGTRFPVEITRRPFEWQGRKVHVAAVRDISDRLEAEKDLRETRDLLFSILDNAPVLIYVNGTDHRYRLVNKAWEKFVGKTAAQVRGCTPREIFSAGTAERFEQSNRRVMETGSTLVYEESVLRRDRRSSFHATKFPLMGQEGRIEAVGGISIDISSLKNAEEELLAAQKQLFQAQKMETLGTLVAGVAHEINNPINLIMFNVSLLQRIWRDVEPILERESLVHPDKKYGGLPHEFLKKDLVWLLRDMEMAANRVASVTRGLKEYSAKTDVMEKKPLLLNEAVRNSLRLAQATLRKYGMRVQLHIDEALPPMMGNLQAVEQVVMNLLTNAMQAIEHERGEIQVYTGFDNAKGLVFVAVSDNGKGIDPLISGRIFDPFFTDRQAEGGTGLGLAVSYSLVKAHGGEITFESEVGKGTAFRVSFPIDGRKQPIRIMAVDDEASFLELIESALIKVPGCEVETASNGTEALLRLGSSPPDLLILDLLMPGMDGLEVMRALRSRPEFSGLRVVIVTGLSDDPRLKEIRSLGVSEVFAKPLRIVDFIEKVKQILEEA
ncbi:MAG: PAS domain S-box protein [Deltaproteobacteria bacterium]|nr:PAS domain S-box protein [Deltaproteobacteria bacterium]